MAEKSSVLIKYKYLEYFDNANLSDTDSWILMKGIIEYDRYGKIPVFNNPVLTALFAVIKLEIDTNRDRWENAVRLKSEAGKKGGAPRGNKNAQKDKQEQTEQTSACFDKDIQAKQTKACFAYKKQAKQAKQADSGSGGDYVNDSGGGSDEREPPPLLFAEIKDRIAARGYFIDDNKALELLIAKTDPAWFQGHSFIDFIAATVQEGYADKPKRERHNIFRKLLFSAQNLRAEYPEWRRQQEQEDEAAEKDLAREMALTARPDACPVCGAALNRNLFCPEQHGGFEFSDDDMEYHFKKYTPFDFEKIKRAIKQGGQGRFKHDTT